MKEREPLVVGGLVALLLALWLGFLIHTSPRFAGSAWGGVLGVSGALLMLAALAYPAVKRIRTVKAWVTRRVSMRTVLGWHMYAGLLGALLGLLHTGHKFESPLGIALTASMLLVVLSGYVGRHLMKQISLEVNEKKYLLTRLELAYRQVAGELAAHPEQVAALRPWSGFWGRLVASSFRVFPHTAPILPATRALDMAESIADVEYAIKSHDTLKRWFAGWLWFHIATSVLLCLLLALHVWAGVHYGLRWFE
jgi:predicted phage tail protein